VHFVSGGGRYLGSFDTRSGSIHRRIRQYQALSNPESCFDLAKKLVSCRAQSQRQLLMRKKRGKSQHQAELTTATNQIKVLIKQIDRVSSLESLLGFEGNIARIYFNAIPLIQPDSTPAELRFDRRNRRPQKDRFSALLGFGDALLLKDVMNAILVVGLEPALGFYHQPRTQASPLALDLMEIFRCHLSQKEREKLRWELEQILTAEDDLLLIGMCDRAIAVNVEFRNIIAMMYGRQKSIFSK
jgi:CRISP-associated protein Cas1